MPNSGKSGGMEMGIYNGIHQVVRFKNGNLRHFFAKKDQGIYFRQLGRNGAWDNPVELIFNTQEDFSLNIDANDNLHLMCRLKTGAVLYMKYDGRIWSRQSLAHFDPTRYNVKYPAVLLFGDNIHIVFAVGTTFDTGFWSLLHFYIEEGRWKSAEIAKFTAGHRISPFYMDASDQHIHLVYRGLSAGKFQIFHCRYNTEHKIWSIPENATHGSGDCSLPALLVQGQTLHLAWVSLDKSNLSVRYRNKPLNNIKADWGSEIVLSKPGTNCTFPQLIFAGGRLWCLWCQNDTLYAASSGNGGGAWSEPLPVDFGRYEHFHLINYYTNLAAEKEAVKVQRILGSLDTGLHLPLLKGYIEIPEYKFPVTPIIVSKAENYPAAEEDRDRSRPEAAAQKGSNNEKQPAEEQHLKRQSIEEQNIERPGAASQIAENPDTKKQSIEVPDDEKQITGLPDVEKQIAEKQSIEEADIKESPDSKESAESAPDTPAASESAPDTPAAAPASSAAGPAAAAPVDNAEHINHIEEAILDDIKNREVQYDAIMSKLEGLVEYNTVLNSEIEELKRMLGNNMEKLHTLSMDMERLDQEIDKLSSRGLFERIFPSSRKPR